MRKKFIGDEHGRAETFWEKNWDRDLEATWRRPPAVDLKLAGLISKYLSTDMLLLEGGCGNCHYVRFFVERGYRVIGVDYAERTVRKAKQFLPHLDVRPGNVLALDFPENHFDAYYSGGVIEHFEEGVDQALSEAYRVLKKHGLLFVTVPHMNLSRRIVGLFRQNCFKADQDGRKAYISENRIEFIVEPPPPDFHFHEYLFTTCEVREFLTRNKFHILKEAPFSAAYGLLDLAPFRRLHATDAKKRSIFNKMFSLPIHFMRYVERKESPFAQVVADGYGQVLSNLKLYVCRALK